MAKNLADWVGGSNFIWARQFSSGRSNSGEAKKKFGPACMRRRVRFNPNSQHVRHNHPSDLVGQQSARDKKLYADKLNAKKNGT